MIETLAAEGRYLAFRISGKLDANDIRALTSTIEERVTAPHNVRMLLLFEDFEGATVGGLATGAVFGLRDGKLVEKLAIVGGKKSEEALAWAVEVFGATIVEVFEPENGEEGWKWLHADDTGEYLSFASFV